MNARPATCSGPRNAGGRHEAVQEQTEIPLFERVTVRVIEEQPFEGVLVLPAPATSSGAQLSDLDLEAVGCDTGGGFVCTWAEVGGYRLS